MAAGSEGRGVRPPPTAAAAQSPAPDLRLVLERAWRQEEPLRGRPHGHGHRCRRLHVLRQFHVLPAPLCVTCDIVMHGRRSQGRWPSYSAAASAGQARYTMDACHAMRYTAVARPVGARRAACPLPPSSTMCATPLGGTPPAPLLAARRPMSGGRMRPPSAGTAAGFGAPAAAGAGTGDVKKVRPSSGAAKNLWDELPKRDLPRAPPHGVTCKLCWSLPTVHAGGAWAWASACVLATTAADVLSSPACACEGGAGRCLLCPYMKACTCVLTIRTCIMRAWRQ